jgi:UDP-2,3-diacylglucosamine pyrophosphatase LpxH
MVLKTVIWIFSILLVTFANSQALDSAAASKEIIFASDTQAPMWIETLWLKSHNNRAATKSIFDNIISREPASVYLLGDVVSLGSSNRQWKPMDNYLKRLRSKGIKVNAALGNHEVLGRSKKGQRKFQERFPKHIKTGYVDTTDSVAVILLNSNFNSLSATEDAGQVEWYRHTLEKLEADSSIQLIITGCHHSPYTNSKIVSSSVSVRKKFVPLFLSSKKSRLFLSGHSHNFEYFKQAGKDFFVIGGGGGLHQPLKHGEGLLQDLSADYKPLFHYLSVIRKGDELQLTSIRLKADFSGFEEGGKFVISKYPNPLVDSVMLPAGVE